jgi:hypothetical protein
MNFLRVKFIIPKSSSFLVEPDQKLKLDLEQGSLIFSIGASEADIFRSYTFKSNDFDFQISEETVQKIIDSLYLLCLEMDIGILINSDLRFSWFSESVRTEIKLEKGISIENDFIGASVVPSGTIFIGSNPITISSNLNFTRFEGLFNKYMRLKLQKSEKLIRAIEIYNSSNYLTIINQSGRFILLMSAVESLIDQPRGSKRLQFSLDSYIKRIKKLKIESEEKDSIVGSLFLLKNASIKRSGKILVKFLLDNEKRYNGFQPSTFFSKSYDLRSKFVHYGITKTTDLNIKNIQMQDFVKDLLIAYFEKICC